MDIKWLEDLLVLLEEKSFTRAALRRHVTQPAFSRRIRLLEEWLGVEIIDRSTKPVQLLPSGLALEESTRDLVNRLYALRSRVQASRQSLNRITFVAQHTLAMSLFPELIQRIKQGLPDTAYRVIPENNDACEAAFLKEGHFMLAYESQYRRFDFSHTTTRSLDLGQGHLIPVIGTRLLSRFDSREQLLSGSLPLLMYQQGGFMAEALANSCLPAVMRDYRVEIICESAFSASLKEMVLADMGIAWLTEGIVSQEIDNGLLVSLADLLGSAELDIRLISHAAHQSAQAEQVFELLSRQYAGVNANTPP